jgi:hypothetical protein
MPSEPLVEVTSSSFARNQCFEYWADVVTQKFVPLECDSSDRETFWGDIRHRRIGLIGNCRSEGFGDECAAHARHDRQSPER